MLFNSIAYLVFLPVVAVLFHATSPRVRRWLLLISSYAFYWVWSIPFSLLLLLSTIVDHAASLVIDGTGRRGIRRAALGVSLLANLGVLATFKYADFFAHSIESLTRRQPWPILGLVLPLGISFYTFQTMSYTIDVYRGHMRARRSLMDVALYVSFFPQLVAGPIIRADTLVPQLRVAGAVDWILIRGGIGMILWGMLKKVYFADAMAPVVNEAFANPAAVSGLSLLAATYAFAVQIYCDFSGYSDIAIGSALLLGFRFPDNFDAPYKARNLQDFWRRWHISLSTWLRDYLYIALGGSRRGPWRTYRNLLLTMLLGGLWHGAGWAVVTWGALHGGALAVLRAWQRRREAAGRAPLLRGRLGRAVAVTFTFHYVCLAWVFFRAPDFGAAVEVLRQIAEFSGGAANLTAHLVGVMAIGACTHFWPKRGYEALVSGFARLHWAWQAAALVAAGLALRSLASVDVVPFIYFQF